MKHCYSLPAAAILFLLMTACDKDDDKEATGALPPSNTSMYPLTIGNTWRYFTDQTFIDDSSAANNVSNQFYTIKKIERTETLGGDLTYAFVDYDSTNSSITNTATFFYNTNSTGFCRYGYYYGSNNHVALIHEQPFHFRIGNMEFNSINDIHRILLDNTLLRADSIILNSPPSIVFKQSMTLNDEWTILATPFVIKKKYVGEVNVPTSFGNFSCRKFEFSYDLDNDGIPEDLHFYQYISSTKGLLKEAIYDPHITAVDANGNPIGTGSYTEESIAVSINF